MCVWTACSYLKVEGLTTLSVLRQRCHRRLASLGPVAEQSTGKGCPVRVLGRKLRSVNLPLRRGHFSSVLVGVIVECVWTVEDLVEGEPAIRTLMMTVPLLATNVVATALVGVQVWYGPVLSLTPHSLTTIQDLPPRHQGLLRASDQNDPG